jgi:hypothetical protein
MRGGLESLSTKQPRPAPDASPFFVPELCGCLALENFVLIASGAGSITDHRGQNDGKAKSMRGLC